MTRTVTSAVLTALEARNVRPVIFVEVDAESGFLRFAANLPPPHRRPPDLLHPYVPRPAPRRHVGPAA